MTSAKILIVDDEPQIRRVLRTTLTSQGYTVAEARTGNEALEQIRNERPDLYLSSDLIIDAVAVTLSTWPTPPDLGMVTSRIATWGFTAWITFAASMPSSASPTTSMSG